MPKSDRNQSGFSVIRAIIVIVLVVVAVVGYFIVSTYVSRHAQANKVEQELNTISLPAGVTLQDKQCGPGDTVDQSSGNCTFTYSAVNMQAGFDSLKQALQALGMKGTYSSANIFYFSGGNPKLTGQLTGSTSSNQIKIFAQLGN